MLSVAIPRDKEFEFLYEIYRELDDDFPQTAKKFRADLRSFCEQADYVDLGYYKLNRFKENGGGLNLRDKMHLFDFVTLRYLPECRQSPNETLQSHAVQIEKAIKSIRERQEGFDPFSFIAEQAMRPEDVDLMRSMAKKYLAYRLSSNTSSLIRFSLNIEFKRGFEISFTNRYDREGIRWSSRGGGLLHGKTLYLIGRARDEGNDKVERGYRVLCLERWRESNVLQGVIISHDAYGPLAARFVAIPSDEHDFSTPKEYAKLIQQRDPKLSPWNPSDHAIDTDRDFLSSHDDREYLDAAMRQTNLALNHSNAVSHEPLGLLHFINNLTGTTLHGYLKPLSSESLKPIDHEHGFDHLVDDFVTRLENLDMSPRDYLAQLLEKGMRVDAG